jgi:glycerol uptake facilitator-like aquaporin
MVAAWIGAAYWFTASTSFANPAITIARSLSDTFAGIRPIDVPGFLAAQIVGAMAAMALGRLLFVETKAAAAVRGPSAQSHIIKTSPERESAGSARPEVVR